MIKAVVHDKVIAFHIIQRYRVRVLVNRHFVRVVEGAEIRQAVGLRGSVRQAERLHVQRAVPKAQADIDAAVVKTFDAVKRIRQAFGVVYRYRHTVGGLGDLYVVVLPVIDPFSHTDRGRNIVSAETEQTDRVAVVELYRVGLRIERINPGGGKENVDRAAGIADIGFQRKCAEINRIGGHIEVILRLIGYAQCFAIDDPGSAVRRESGNVGVKVVIRDCDRKCLLQIGIGAGGCGNGNAPRL